MFEELNRDPGEEGLKRAARIFFVLAAFSLIGLVIYLVLALMSGTFPVLQLGIYAVACVVAYLTGKGIEEQRPWAKWAGIILGILELFNFPIGTVIGIAILVYMRRAIKSNLFAAKPVAA